MAIGRAPQAGVGKTLIDSDWLLGVAGGDNLGCQTVSALVAATQVGAPVLGVNLGTPPTEAELIYITASIATGSLQLPQAAHGRVLMVLNNTANTVNIYANPNVSRLTGVLDVIVGLGASNTNPTAVTMLTFTTTIFFCPVDGVWAQK